MISKRLNALLQRYASAAVDNSHVEAWPEKDRPAVRERLRRAKEYLVDYLEELETLAAKGEVAEL